MIKKYINRLLVWMTFLVAVVLCSLIARATIDHSPPVPSPHFSQHTIAALMQQASDYHAPSLWQPPSPILAQAPTLNLPPQILNVRVPASNHNGVTLATLQANNIQVQAQWDVSHNAFTVRGQGTTGFLLLNNPNPNNYIITVLVKDLFSNLNINYQNLTAIAEMTINIGTGQLLSPYDSEITVQQLVKTPIINLVVAPGANLNIIDGDDKFYLRDYTEIYLRLSTPATEEGGSGHMLKIEVSSSDYPAPATAVIEVHVIESEFFTDDSDMTLWLVGGQDGTTRDDVPTNMRLSPDGFAWSDGPALPGAQKYFGNGIVAVDGIMYLFSGTDAAGNEDNTIWRSLDGVSWTELETPIGATRYPPRRLPQVVFFDEHFYLLGNADESNIMGDFQDGGHPQNDVWRSARGYSWTRIDNGPTWPRRANYAVAANQDYMFVIGGDNAKDVWRSANGTNWQKTPSLPDSGGEIRRVPWAVSSHIIDNQDYLYVMGGHNGSVWLDDVWRTSNHGNSWDKVSTEAFRLGRGAAAAASHNGVLYMAGGTSGGFHFNEHTAWASDDGSEWVELPNYVDDIKDSRQNHRLLSYAPTDTPPPLFLAASHITEKVVVHNGNGILHESKAQSQNDIDHYRFIFDDGGGEFLQVKAYDGRPPYVYSIANAGFYYQDGALSIAANAATGNHVLNLQVSDDVGNRATDNINVEVIRVNNRVPRLDINAYAGITTALLELTNDIADAEVQYSITNEEYFYLSNKQVFLQATISVASSQSQQFVIIAASPTYSMTLQATARVLIRPFAPGQGTLWALGAYSINLGLLNNIQSSPTGQQWHDISAPGYLYNAGAIKDGVMYMFTGYDGSTTGNDVWRTVDGHNWSLFTVSDGGAVRYPVTQNPRVVAFKGHFYLLGNSASVNNSARNDVWQSGNGSDWTRLVADGDDSWPKRGGYSTAANQNYMFVVGGFGYEDVWRSTDGISWEQTANLPDVVGDTSRSYPMVVSHSVNNVEYLYVMGGNSDNNDIWRSRDHGNSWEKISTQNIWSGRWGAAVASHRNLLYVLGGSPDAAIPTRNDIWASSDGATWTKVGDAAYNIGFVSALSFTQTREQFPLFWGVPPQVYETITLQNAGLYLTPKTNNTADTFVFNFTNLGEFLTLQARDGDGNYTYRVDGLAAGFAFSNGTVSIARPSPGPHSFSAMVQDGSGGFDNINVVMEIPDPPGVLAVDKLAGDNSAVVILQSDSPAVRYTLVGESTVQFFLSGNDVKLRNTIGGGTYLLPIEASSPDYNYTYTATARVQVHQIAANLQSTLWLVGGRTGQGGNSARKPARVSDNGFGWSDRTMPDYPYYDYGLQVRDGVMYLFFGNDSGDLDGNDVWWSVDGNNWAELHAAEENLRYSPRDKAPVVLFKNDFYLLGGAIHSNVESRDIDVWRSSNGADWTRIQENAFPRRVNYVVAATKDYMFAIGGSQKQEFFNDIWRSPDGETWEAATVPDDSYQTLLGPAVATHTINGQEYLYLMGGRRSSGGAYLNKVWRSADNGDSWEEITTGNIWSARGAGAAISYGGRLYMIGGTRNYNNNNDRDVWASGDGAEWTRLDDFASQGRYGHRLAIFSQTREQYPFFFAVPKKAESTIPWTGPRAEISVIADHKRHYHFLFGDDETLLNLSARGGDGAHTYTLLTNLPGLSYSNVGGEGILAVSPVSVQNRTGGVLLRASDGSGAFQNRVVNLAINAHINIPLVELSVAQSAVIAGQAVLTMSADQGDVSYAIVGGAEYFTLTNNQILVREHMPQGVYTLRLEASAIGRVMTATAQVRTFNPSAVGNLWLLGGGIVGQGTQNDGLVSPDGFAWHVGVTLPDEGDSFSDYSAVVRDGAIYLFPSNYNNSNTDNIWRTMDGETWDKPESSFSSLRYSARLVAEVVVFKNDFYLLGGNNKNDVWKSSDGVDWTRIDNGNTWPLRVSYEVAATQNWLYVIGGRNEQDIWRSSNGVLWQQTQTHPTCSGCTARSVASAAAHTVDGTEYLYVMGGYNGSNRTNDVWRSSNNGKTWEELTTTNIWPARNNALLLSHQGLLYLAGGRVSGSEYLNDVWTSRDGKDWVYYGDFADDGRSGAQLVSFTPSDKLYYPLFLADNLPDNSGGIQITVTESGVFATVKARDGDDNYVYSLDPPIAGFSVDGGQLRADLDVIEGNEHNLNIRVVDGQGDTAEKQIRVGVSRAIQLVSTYINAFSRTQLQAVATLQAAGHDAATFSSPETPAGIYVNPDGAILVGSPILDGQYNFEVNIEGGLGLRTAQSEVVLDIARELKIYDAPRLAVSVGVLHEIYDFVSYGGRSPTYRIVDGNAYFSLVGESKKLRLRQTTAGGVYTVRIEASDVVGQKVYAVATVDVIGPPPPDLLEIYPRIFVVDQGTATDLYTFNFAIGGTGTFSLLDNGGGHFTMNNGVLRALSSAPVGDYQLRLQGINQVATVIAGVEVRVINENENELWILGGRTSSNSSTSNEVKTKIWRSPTGVQWTNIANISGFSFTNPVIRDNILYILSRGGSNDGSLRSKDGTTWEFLAKPSFLSQKSAPGVVVTDKLYLLGERYQVAYDSDVWASGDGYDWTRLSTDGWPSRYYYGVASAWGYLFVLGGVGSDNAKDIWRSADGIHWQKIADYPESLSCSNDDLFYPTATSHRVGGVEYLYTMGGACANNNNSANNDVWRSDDFGVSWTRLVPSVTTKIWSPRLGGKALSHRGKLYMIGGNKNNLNANADHLSDVWASDDGVDWTKQAEGVFPARWDAAVVSFNPAAAPENYPLAFNLPDSVATLPKAGVLVDLNAHTNDGSGSYNYVLQNDQNYFSVNGANLQVNANAPVGDYRLTIVANGGGTATDTIKVMVLPAQVATAATMTIVAQTAINLYTVRTSGDDQNYNILGNGGNHFIIADGILSSRNNIAVGLYTASVAVSYVEYSLPSTAEIVVEVLPQMAFVGEEPFAIIGDGGPLLYSFMVTNAYGGEYDLRIVAGDDNNYFVISGDDFLVDSIPPAGVYNVVVEASDPFQRIRRTVRLKRVATYTNERLWRIGGGNSTGLPDGGGQRMINKVYSFDGTSWSTHAAFPNYFSDADAAVKDGVLYVFQGNRATVSGVEFEDGGSSSEVWRTLDGETWERLRSTPGIGNAYWAVHGAQVAVLNDTFYLVRNPGRLTNNGSYSNYEVNNQLWSSGDGADWTRLNNISNLSNGYVFGVSGGYLVRAKGVNRVGSVNNEAGVVRSRDGNTWTNGNARGPINSSMAKASHIIGNKEYLYYYGGNRESGGFTNDIWRTGDGGLTWELVDNNPGIDAVYAGFASYRGDLYIFGGSRGFTSDVREFRRSTDDGYTFGDVNVATGTVTAKSPDITFFRGAVATFAPNTRSHYPLFMPLRGGWVEISSDGGEILTLVARDGASGDYRFWTTTPGYAVEGSVLIAVNATPGEHMIDLYVADGDEVVSRDLRVRVAERIEVITLPDAPNLTLRLPSQDQYIHRFEVVRGKESLSSDTVSYSIVSGNTGNAFRLESDGSLFLTPNAVSGTTYNLQVQVVVNSGDPVTATAMIVVE